MSDTTPYEKLGVTDDASFEEVRDARDRMLHELDGNEQQQELIEAAYDAILMDRLRARQEGKIAVPDRIRFPERLSSNIPATIQAQATKATPNWLANLIDYPSRKSILVSASVFAVLGGLSLVSPAAVHTWLAFGLLASIYLLNIKRNRFGRAVLIALAGLSLAVVVGMLINQIPFLSAPYFPSEKITILMMLVMWLVTCFLN